MNSGMIVQKIYRKCLRWSATWYFTSSIRMVKLTVTGRELKRIMQNYLSWWVLKKLRRSSEWALEEKFFGDIITVGLSEHQDNFYQGEVIDEADILYCIGARWSIYLRLIFYFEGFRHCRNSVFQNLWNRRGLFKERMVIQKFNRYGKNYSI